MNSPFLLILHGSLAQENMYLKTVDAGRDTPEKRKCPEKRRHLRTAGTPKRKGYTPKRGIPI
jgi:hypothetical protein